MRVRNGSIADLEAVTRLHYEITRTAYGDLFPSDRPPPPLDDLRREWSTTLADVAVDVFVAEPDDIVGSAILRPVGQKVNSVAEVKRVHVATGWWRHGIGTALLDRVVESAIERGFGQLNIWVIDANTRARRFFEYYGWVLHRGEIAHHSDQGITEVRYDLVVETSRPDARRSIPS